MRKGIQEDDCPGPHNHRPQSTPRVHLRSTLYPLPPQTLGFDSFTAEVEDVLKDHKQQQKVSPFIFRSICYSTVIQDREKKVSKFEQSGMTEQELLAAQEELFAASRAKFQSTG